MTNSQRIVSVSRSSQHGEESGVAITGEREKEPGPGKIPTTGVSIYNNVVELEGSPGKWWEKGQPEMRQAKSMGLLNENAFKHSSLERSTSGESETKLSILKRRKI